VGIGNLGLRLLLAIHQAAGSPTRSSAAELPARTAATEELADPDSLRTRFQDLLTLAASSDPREVGPVLDTARGLATAIARTWGDSFPLETVGRFVSWSPAQRAGKLMADNLRRAGNEALSREGPEAALVLWRRSVAQATAAGDSAGIAAGLGNIGAGWYSASELDSAAAYLERSKSMALAIGDDRTVGNALGSLANVAKSRGRFREAQRLFTKASQIRARVGDPRGLAADLNNLGLVTEATGQLDSATSLYRRALALNRRHHRDGPAAANLVNLGNLASSRGDYAEAGELYQAALTIRRRRGERPEQATVLYDLGQLATRRGDYPAGVAHLRESLALYEATGLTDGAVAARTVLSNLYQVMGQVQEAVTELELARQSAESAGLSPQTRAEIALTSGDLAVTLNDPAAAERHYVAAAQLYGTLGDLEGESAAAQGLGVLLLRRNQPGAARARFEQALRERMKRGEA
jgi:tetratricopeptide (TPR) repeat protein